MNRLGVAVARKSAENIKVKCPEYTLVAAEGLDQADDIMYNGMIIRIHQVRFEEPEDPTESAVLHINCDIMDGDERIAETEKFKSDIHLIVMDIIMKNVAMRELKREIEERRGT